MNQDFICSEPSQSKERLVRASLNVTKCDLHILFCLKHDTVILEAVPFLEADGGAGGTECSSSWSENLLSLES